MILVALIVIGVALWGIIDTLMIGFKEFGFKGLFYYPDDDE